MWVVVENIPGYLPESEPYLCDTWEEVISWARDVAADWEQFDWKVIWGENLNVPGPGIILRAEDGSLGRILEVNIGEE